MIKIEDEHETGEVQIADYRTDEGMRIRDDQNSPCLTSSHNSTSEPSRMMGLVIKPVLTPNRENKRQDGRRFKEDGEPMFTLTGQDTHGVMIREASKKGYAEAEEGDSIDLSFPNSKTRKGRVGKGEAHTLDTGGQQYTIDKDSEAVEIYDDYNSKMRTDGVTGTITQNTGNKALRNGQKVVKNLSIRRLTPTECERLQGFPDGWTEGQSDTQRYKQLGNAVSVPVVAAVGKKLNLAGKNVSNCND